MRSDSLWLINQLRREQAARLAAAFVEQSPAGPRLVIRVTGQARIPAMRLAGRSRQTPVIVQYGARHSLREVEAIRMDSGVRRRVAGLLPDLQGEGYDERAGAIHLDVYAADLPARGRLASLCGPLRAAYGMPVRIEPIAGRLTDGVH